MVADNMAVEKIVNRGKDTKKSRESIGIEPLKERCRETSNFH